MAYLCYGRSSYNILTFRYWSLKLSCKQFTPRLHQKPRFIAGFLMPEILEKCNILPCWLLINMAYLSNSQSSYTKTNGLISVKDITRSSEVDGQSPLQCGLYSFMGCENLSSSKGGLFLCSIIEFFWELNLKRWILAKIKALFVVIVNLWFIFTLCVN